MESRRGHSYEWMRTGGFFNPTRFLLPERKFERTIWRVKGHTMRQVRRCSVGQLPQDKTATSGHLPYSKHYNSSYNASKCHTDCLDILLPTVWLSTQLFLPRSNIHIQVPAQPGHAQVLTSSLPHFYSQITPPSFLYLPSSSSAISSHPNNQHNNINTPH